MKRYSELYILNRVMRCVAEEKCHTTASSRASSADRAEKRTISMTFPYTPLRYIVVNTGCHYYIGNLL